jgi:hypothetical protein
MSLVSLCPLMFRCNLKFSRMTDGRRLFTQQSPNIVAGQICLYLLLLHLLTQMSRLSPAHSPVQSSHAKDSKEAMHDKGKVPPPLPQVIQPNLFHPLMLMSSMRSSLKALHSLRLIQRSQKGIVATKGKLPLKVENIFDFTLLLLLRTVDC